MGEVDRADQASGLVSPRGILALSAATGFLISLAQAVVPIASPRIAVDLDADIADLQLITNALFFPLVALLIFGGLAADRWGRRPVFRVGVLLLLLGAAASVAAPSVEALAAARLLQGIGAACALPTSLALLRVVYHGPALIRAVGIWVGCTVGGAALGPIIGGAIMSIVPGWRAVFLPEVAIAALILVGSVPLLRALDSSVAAVHLRLGWNGALIVGLVLTMAGLVALGREGVPWGAPVAVLAVAALILLLVARRSSWILGSEAPAGAGRQLVVGVAVAVCGLFSVTGVFFLSAIYLQRDLGLSPVVAAVALLPQTGLGAALAFAGGPVIGRVGLRVALVAAFAIEAAGLFWLLALDGRSGYLALVPAQVAIALAVAIIPTASLVIVLGSGPPERSGVLAGVQSSALNLGNLLSIAAFSIVMAVSMPQVFAAALPPGVRDVAAATTGARLAAGPNPSPEAWAPDRRAVVAAAQRGAFAEGVGYAGAMAGVVSLAGLLIALRFAPRRAR
jgi:MFS family permease